MPLLKQIKLRNLFLATSMLTAGSTGGALAQQVADQTAETVIVTGSHIETPGFQAPTPVTSIGELQMQNQDVINSNDLQYSMPQLAPQLNFQTIAGNGAGATFFNLRGLGDTRTLILVDGLRVMPTGYDGTTDANILPTSLIKRVDVVTGGASAAYGSDAVSGVVNFILDTDYEGIKGSFEAGQSQYHDNDTLDAQITGGFAFDGDRGHVVLALDLYSDGGANGNTSSTGGVARRHWANQQYALIPGGTGSTSEIYPSGVTFSQMTAGGVIDSGPLKGIYFGPGGSLNSMVYGTNISATYMVGGTGGEFQTMGSIYPENAHQNFFTHVTYDLTPDITVWGQALLVHETGLSPITPNYDNGTGASPELTINSGNPFIPAALQTMMTADNVSSFVLGPEDLELGLNTETSSNNYAMWNLGLKGKLGNNWTWDATGEYSGDSYIFQTLNDRNNTKWFQATNVIANPAVGGVAGVPAGAPICASTVANPSNGCVPINVFGVNSITPQMAAYVDGSNWNSVQQEAWDMSANLQGVVLHDWAGDISMAVGGEARRDSLHGYADPTTLAKEWRAGNTEPFQGDQEVEEGYLETDVPLLKDFPGAQAFDFNAAGRVTNYKTSGVVETWKLGLNDSVNDEIRIRATYSSDIRAPVLSELYAAPSNGVAQVFNDLNASTQTVSTITAGNPNLTPEQASTFTGGVVYSPAWLPGFTTSIDYYVIHIHNGIQTTTDQQQVDNCYLYHVTSACSLITTNASGNITSIYVEPYNVGLEQQNGIDFEIDYSLPGSSIWDYFDGNFGFRTIATYTGQITSELDGVTTQADGQAANLPKWAVVANANYTTDKWMFELDYRYTGAVVFNNTYVQGVVNPPTGVTSISNNDIASRYYFNTLVQYQLLDHWKIFAAVDNVFNVSPPVDPSNNLIEPETLVSQYYDRVGRDYHVGFRFNF
jgi:iron complex outermembrane recepter protein